MSFLAARRLQTLIRARTGWSLAQAHRKCLFVRQLKRCSRAEVINSEVLVSFAVISLHELAYIKVHGTLAKQMGFGLYKVIGLGFLYGILGGSMPHLLFGLGMALG